MREAAGADGRRRLTLSGCLDIATAPRLDARLRELEERMLQVELDLENVSFIDLQGLRVIHTRLLSVPHGSTTILVLPLTSRCVRRLLDLAGIDLWPEPQSRPLSGQADFDGRLVRKRNRAPRRVRTSRH